MKTLKEFDYDLWAIEENGRKRYFARMDTTADCRRIGAERKRSGKGSPETGAAEGKQNRSGDHAASQRTTSQRSNAKGYSCGAGI